MPQVSGATEWYSPCAFAVIRGRVESVRILLNHGGDATVRTRDDRALYEPAEEKGDEEIAGLLKQCCGKR